MNIVLFDEPGTKINLLPFTFTRPISEIRIGILTIREKWEKSIHGSFSYLTSVYLSTVFPLEKAAKNLYLNGCILPNKDLIGAIKAIKDNQMLVGDGIPIAFYGNIDTPDEIISSSFISNYERIEFEKDFISIQNTYDIFIKNETANREDFLLLTKGRKSYKIEDPHTKVYNENDIFIEENVTIRASILNAERGPIYIGKNATIGEGSIIRGASSIGLGSYININARIIGDTTIGPYCKVGGEISNSVIFGNSNKAHDGFLGNSIIGEWCNIGANTNTSNLKNNYNDVHAWNYNQEGFVDTGRLFYGLMMGDHSKCGINTMFNTGTVVGVSCNIFGSGFQKKFIPSFSWGGAEGVTTYKLQKALDVIPKVYNKRKKTFTKEDEDILKHIFEITKKHRTGEQQ